MDRRGADGTHPESPTSWRTQTSVEELRKKLALPQEAIHQGLRESAKLEKSQMSKITPGIRKFFKGGSDSGSETEAEGEWAAPGCGGVSDVPSKAHGHVPVVTRAKPGEAWELVTKTSTTPRPVTFDEP